MAKINIPNIAGGFNLSKINSSLETIETHLNEKVLYRDNPQGEPNQMKNPLDMNGQHIYNLPEPSLPHEPVRKQDLNALSDQLNYEKVVRVEDIKLDPLPDVVLRRGKFLSFDGEGQPQTVVQNESVPVLIERLNNTLLVYETLTEATSKAPELPDGQLVLVTELQKKYVVVGGGLVFHKYEPVRGVVENSGASGNGVDDDSLPIKTTQFLDQVVNLDTNKVYNIGSSYSEGSDLDVNINGLGKIKWSEYELGGYALRKNFLEESLYLTPDSWFQKTRVNSAISPEYPPYAPPGRGNDLVNIFNTVMSWRSSLGKPGVINVNTTAFGANIGVTAEDWNLTDAFGADAGMFMRLSDRNTLLGTETAVWAGAPNRDYLLQYNHDWYRNTPPNEWTAGNTQLEANNPGVGAAVYGFSNYPTVKEQVRYNVLVGRDAGVHFLRGEGNTFTGYSAGYNAFDSSNNCYYGTNAGRDNFFGGNNVFFGSQAGRAGAWTRQSTFIGYGAGRSVSGAEAEASSNSVALGYLAADNVKKLNNSVVIGSLAASGLTELSNKLFIGGAGNITVPLIGGDFTNSRASIAVPPGSERARLHVRSTEQGSTGLRNGILVEGGLVNFETGVGGFAGSAVYTSGDVNAAGFQYGVDSQSWQISIAGVNRWRVHVNDIRPGADNVYSVGTAAARPSVIFSGTGTINTSDAREKTEPLLVTDSVLDAWEDVQLICYKWLSALQVKGDGARTHFGVIAQQVRDAFAAKGLDGTAYGLLCYDEWEAKPEVLDGEGNIVEPAQEAGNRWGIRADQCLFLEAAYQRRRADRIEARLTAAGL